MTSDEFGTPRKDTKKDPEWDFEGSVSDVPEAQVRTAAEPKAESGGYYEAMMDEPVVEEHDEPEVEEYNEPEIEEYDEPEIEEEAPVQAQNGPAAETPPPAVTSDPPYEGAKERKYRRPSAVSQMFTVYGLQMKLYAKNKTIYLMAFLVALIPISMKLVPDYMLNLINLFFNVGDEPSAAYILALLPLMIVAIPAMLCGRTMSSEFKNRTVYLNFPLPLSRLTFYAGKFLAGLTLCVVIFMSAIFVANVIGSDSVGNMRGAVVVCLAGVFAMAATAYGLSPYFRRGSTAVTIVLMILLPFLLFVLFALLAEYNIMSEDSAKDLIKNVIVLPIFSPYQTMWLMDYSLGDMAGGLFELLAGDRFGTFAYATAAAVWGTLFLLLGARKVKNKEL